MNASKVAINWVIGQYPGTNRSLFKIMEVGQIVHAPQTAILTQSSRGVTSFNKASSSFRKMKKRDEKKEPSE